RQVTDGIVQISERVVFAFERRPLGRCFARLNLADRLPCVFESGGVEALVFSGRREVTGVTEINLRAQVVWLIGKNLRARAVSLCKLLLVDQTGQHSLALVTFVE